MPHPYPSHPKVRENGLKFLLNTEKLFSLLIRKHLDRLVDDSRWSPVHSIRCYWGTKSLNRTRILNSNKKQLSKLYRESNKHFKDYFPNVNLPSCFPEITSACESENRKSKCTGISVSRSSSIAFCWLQNYIFEQLKIVRHTRIAILNAKNKTANNLSGRILIPAVHRI